MRSTIALSALLTLSAPALGQATATLPLTSAGPDLVLSAAGHDLTLPHPSWLASTSAETISQDAFVRFVDEGEEARLEIYPRGEGEAFWTTLYGARINQAPDTTLAELRSVVIDLYAETCRPESVALFQLEPDAEDAIPPLGFVCGNYRDVTGLAGQGEVMVMGFYKAATGSAIVYQEWRGDAFNPADPASWPVSTDEVEQRIAQFKTEASLASAD